MAIEIRAPITANVWKILVEVGQSVSKSAPLMILESMKMEIPVEAPEDGKILEIKVAEGSSVIEEDVLVIMEEA